MEKFLVKIITDGTIRGEIEYLQDWHEGGGNMKAVWRMSPFAATQFDTYADAVDAIHRYHDGKSYYQIEKIFT